MKCTIVRNDEVVECMDTFRSVPRSGLVGIRFGRLGQDGACGGVGSCVDVGVGLAVEDGGETRREGAVGSCVDVGVGPDRGEWGKKDSGDRDRTLGTQCCTAGASYH